MRPGQIALVIITLVAAGLGGPACGNIEGGAVELSWRLRPEPGVVPNNPCDPFVCCDPQQPGTTPIEKMQLSWTVEGADGGEGSSASWDCDAGNGVTRFDVPPGDVLLSVAPLCDGFDTAPETFIAPAPIARHVTVGDTVSLGAVEVLLRISSCDSQPCICQNQASSAQEIVAP